MDLLNRIQNDFIIGDGGYGAMILSRGLAEGECEELWNLTHADEIEDLHRSFIAAGSELVQANTFKANRLFLAKHGLAEQTTDINRAGVAIARCAAGSGVFVAGSIGPIGVLLEPYGDLTHDEARAIFEEQAHAQADADAIFIETFTDLSEAEIAVAAAKTTSLPVIASLSYQSSGATVMGVRPEEAASRLTTVGADIVGANCGIGPKELFPIIERWMQNFSGAVIAQPNAGMPQLIDGKTVFPDTPETMAEFAVRFRELGVKIIGGCCGTRPDHIRAMTTALRG